MIEEFKVSVDIDSKIQLVNSSFWGIMFVIPNELKDPFKKIKFRPTISMVSENTSIDLKILLLFSMIGILNAEKFSSPLSINNFLSFLNKFKLKN